MKKYLLIGLTLYLGSSMIVPGISKIADFKDLPKSTFLIEKYSDKSIDENIENYESSLRYSNFKFGLKQSGYFWQFLAFSELLFGFLLFFRRTRFIAGFLLLPITVNIFFVNLFLESFSIGLFYVFTLFLSNLLILNYYKKDIIKISLK